MKIYELAKEVNPYVVEMRRYFHEHPELSTRRTRPLNALVRNWLAWALSMK